jgi:hypothetical protein
MAELSDTHPAIEAMIADGYRRMTAAQKLERVAALTRALDELALADVRRRYPDASAREQQLRVASRRLGSGARRVLMLAEPLLVVAHVAQALDALAVRYVVGGSVASSLYGVPRSTQDVDIVAELREEHVAPFVAALQATFYVDADMIREAISRRASFNVVHLATMFKADVFIPRLDAWSRGELSRGVVHQVESGGATFAIRLASAEDTLLHKLVWYRLGGEISERQWKDVLGVLKIQGRALDAAYLDEWARALDVADLLERARHRS